MLCASVQLKIPRVGSDPPHTTAVVWLTVRLQIFYFCKISILCFVSINLEFSASTLNSNNFLLEFSSNAVVVCG